MNRLIRHFYTYLNYRDTRRAPTAEERHRINTVFLLCGLYSLVAITFLLLFGAKAWFTGESFHARTLTGFAVATLVSYLLIWRSGLYHLAKHQIVALMATLCLYLFYSGGDSNSGPLWYFVFPQIALFLQGRRVGLYSVALLFVLTFALYQLEPAAFRQEKYIPPFLQRLAAVYLAVTALSYLFAFFRDEAENKLRQNNRQLESIFHWDRSSGLFSRSHMEKILEAEASKHQRYGIAFSVVLLDIDDLKSLNTLYSYSFGDYVIQEISQLLKLALRKVDIAGRWGGGSFVLILTGTRLAGAAVIAERLRREIEGHAFNFDTSRAHLTVSCGVAEYRGGRLEKFLQRCESCLAEAKTAGKNCVRFRKSLPQEDGPPEQEQVTHERALREGGRQ